MSVSLTRLLQGLFKHTYWGGHGPPSPMLRPSTQLIWPPQYGPFFGKILFSNVEIVQFYVDRIDDSSELLHSER